jgi:hypothetical protein
MHGTYSSMMCFWLNTVDVWTDGGPWRSDVWVWRWGVMDVTRRINEERSFQLQGPSHTGRGTEV